MASNFFQSGSGNSGPVPTGGFGCTPATTTPAAQGFSFGRAMQWSIPYKGKESPLLDWVSVSDGTVPSDAVEGGWCNDTKEPRYIARRKYVNEVVVGYVLKSTKKFYGGQKQYADSSDESFEVLVNPLGKEKLSWVPLFQTTINNQIVSPKNPLQCGKQPNGAHVYAGRSYSIEKSGSIPGICTPTNGLFVKQHDRNKFENVTEGFEVLCLVGDDPSATVERVYLYDLEYADISKALIFDQHVLLSSDILENNTAETQKFRVASRIDISDQMKWDIGRTFQQKCEIKSAVPYLPFGATNNKEESIIFTEIGILPPPGLAGAQPTGGFGGFGRQPAAAFGAPAIATFVQSASNTKSKRCLLDNTVAYVFLGITAKRPQTFSPMPQEVFRVPKYTTVRAGFKGLERTLTFPFTAKLKSVYSNDLVKDEDVKGVYSHTQLISIAPFVTGNLS